MHSGHIITVYKHRKCPKQTKELRELRAKLKTTLAVAEEAVCSEAKLFSALFCLVASCSSPAPSGVSCPDVRKLRAARDALGLHSGSASSLKKLYAYLTPRCRTLKEASNWINDWTQNCNSRLPWEQRSSVSSRAMAGHLSNILEGKTYTSGYAAGGMTYLDTKFGAKLYAAAWEIPGQ